MSATEILDELTKLTPAELEIVYRRAVELHQGQAVEASRNCLPPSMQPTNRLQKKAVWTWMKLAASWLRGIRRNHYSFRASRSGGNPRLHRPRQSGSSAEVWPKIAG